MSFSYSIGDGNVVTAHASLDITPVNDAPAVRGAVTLAPIDEDFGARLITQGELLANASDVDGPSLTAVNLQISAGLGALADNGNGTWSYTPAPTTTLGVVLLFGHRRRRAGRDQRKAVHQSGVGRAAESSPARRATSAHSTADWASTP